MRKLFKITLTLFFITIIVFGFALPVNMAGNWYQQFLPNLNGRSVQDIFFIDSLTGWAVTNNLSPGDTGYVLKTTNSGDVWLINLVLNKNLKKVKFINANVGFVSGGSGGGTAYLTMTTNGGNNWISVNTPAATSWLDMSVLSIDTIWLVDNDGLVGGVFRTTNGGVNWQVQGNFSSSNPSHIYMYNARIGFIDGLKKTTNGGQNWNPIAGGEPSLFFDMHFHDSLLGWKCHQNMRKTTDGGVTWINQTLPSGGNILLNYMLRFSNINKDTIWGAGGVYNYGGPQSRGMIFRTTNGGDNWLFQIPDTSINIFQYSHIQFINERIGWVYAPSRGIHTVLGGDTNFLLGIQQISSSIPSSFHLYQNYPNPFNPVTNIRYELKEKSIVNLTVFDIAGKQIAILVNQTQHAGIYETDFKAVNLSSGVYFYKILVTADNFTYTDTKKMILVK